MPMPKLSPSMKSGKILQWKVKEKELLTEYQNLMILETTTILDEYRSTPSEIHTMEVEVMEEMYVAKLLAEEGQSYKVGTPIAILCEDEDDIEKAGKVDLSSLPNMYSENYPKTAPILALWQAYSIEE